MPVITARTLDDQPAAANATRSLTPMAPWRFGYPVAFPCHAFYNPSPCQTRQASVAAFRHQHFQLLIDEPPFPRSDCALTGLRMPPPPLLKQLSLTTPKPLHLLPRYADPPKRIRFAHQAATIPLRFLASAKRSVRVVLRTPAASLSHPRPSHLYVMVCAFTIDPADSP